MLGSEILEIPSVSSASSLPSNQTDLGRFGSLRYLHAGDYYRTIYPDGGIFTVHWDLVEPDTTSQHQQKLGNNYISFIVVYILYRIVYRDYFFTSFSILYSFIIPTHTSIEFTYDTCTSRFTISLCTCKYTKIFSFFPSELYQFFHFHFNNSDVCSIYFSGV